MTIQVFDSKNRLIDPATVSCADPVPVQDVEDPVHTLAREARPFIRTLLRLATEETKSVPLDAPQNIRDFVSSYCADAGVRVSWVVGPTSKKVYAVVQRGIDQ